MSSLRNKNNCLYNSQENNSRLSSRDFRAFPSDFLTGRLEEIFCFTNRFGRSAISVSDVI